MHKRPSSVHPEICLSDEAQRAYQTLNGRVRLFAVEGRVPRGIQALREFKSALRARRLDEEALLSARLSLRKNGEPINGGRPPAPDQSMAFLLLRLVLGLGDIASAFVRKLGKKPTVKADHIDLIGYFEQPPPGQPHHSEPGNRRTRAAQVCVDCACCHDRNLRTAALLFGMSLRVPARTFQPAPWLEDEQTCHRSSTSHHLGTTRMSDDPQRGVVDRECRVQAWTTLCGRQPLSDGGGHFLLPIVASACVLPSTCGRASNLRPS